VRAGSGRRNKGKCVGLNFYPQTTLTNITKKHGEETGDISADSRVRIPPPAPSYFLRVVGSSALVPGFVFYLCGVYGGEGGVFRRRLFFWLSGSWGLFCLFRASLFVRGVLRVLGPWTRVSFESVPCFCSGFVVRRWVVTMVSGFFFSRVKWQVCFCFFQCVHFYIL
jgi:hypothetical protein